MKEQLNQWLTNYAALAGVQACGLRHTDRTTFTKSHSMEFPTEALENAWRCVADTFHVLRHRRLEAVNLRWVFEQSLLYCLTRSDGVCLMVFATPKMQDFDTAGLQTMFAEFQQVGSETAWKR